MNQVGNRHGIDIPKDEVAAFCKRHRIRKLSSVKGSEPFSYALAGIKPQRHRDTEKWHRELTIGAARRSNTAFITQTLCLCASVVIVADGK